MPEGAELKISSEIVKSIVQGCTIVGTAISKNGRYAEKEISGFDPKKIISSIVDDVAVKGKFMYWRLSNGQYMFCTYGMTGQWSTQENKHTCFSIELLDRESKEIKKIHFNDQRHFGTIKFGDGSDLDRKLRSLGWDPFQEEIDSAFLKIKKKINKVKNIGELLMDQKIFSGCGNYIRAEALYRSKMNPWKQGNSLTDSELLELCNNVRDVMTESYLHQGASFKNYINADGGAGNYSFNFKVYGQKNDPNGFEIRRDPMGNRVVHWCPKVQQL
jgi:DNA-formamidopyrimidine glycosylase